MIPTERLHLPGRGRVRFEVRRSIQLSYGRDG